MAEDAENPKGNESTQEQSVDRKLMALAERLGFSETPELVQIKEKLKPAQLIDESMAIISDYINLGIKIIEETTDPDDPKPEIGLIVASASLKYTNGFIDEYKIDMNDANFYASDIGKHEIALELRHILHRNLNYREM